MNKRAKITLSVLLCCALGGVGVWLNAGSSVKGQSQSNSVNENRTLNPLARLNEQAKAAKPDDEKSVRVLADEVFNTLALDNAPAGMSDAVKERLTRAEINYRKGQGEGIPETNIVRVVNGLAKKFNAPEYAKTSGYEVRRLRMGVLPFMPQFIAKERPADSKRRKQVGSSINPNMSPLEAAFLTVLMLQQKQFNPDYQQTHAEIVARWSEKHGRGKAANRANGERPQAEIREATAREKEVRQAIERGVSSMSPRELLNLPDGMTNVLGIER